MFKLKFPPGTPDNWPPRDAKQIRNWMSSYAGKAKKGAVTDPSLEVGAGAGGVGGAPPGPAPAPGPAGFVAVAAPRPIVASSHPRPAVAAIDPCASADLCHLAAKAIEADAERETVTGMQSRKRRRRTNDGHSSAAGGMGNGPCDPCPTVMPQPGGVSSLRMGAPNASAMAPVHIGSGAMTMMAPNGFLPLTSVASPFWTAPWPPGWPTGMANPPVAYGLGPHSYVGLAPGPSTVFAMPPMPGLPDPRLSVSSHLVAP